MARTSRRGRTSGILVLLGLLVIGALVGSCRAAKDRALGGPDLASDDRGSSTRDRYVRPEGGGTRDGYAQDYGMLLRSSPCAMPSHELIKNVGLVICDAGEDIVEPGSRKRQLHQAQITVQ